VPRRPRIYFSGAIYHAYGRGVDGNDIFIDDQDRIAFLAIMRRLEKELSARVISFCLMTNHFHLAIQVGPVSLSIIMQRLLTNYCMFFNKRHERTGHLFGGRHNAKLCADDRYLAGLIHYIHMNPVRAGIVTSPGDWPWSSYVPGETVGSDVMDFDPWPKDAERVDMMRQSVDPIDLDAVGRSVTSRTGVGLDAMRSKSRLRVVIKARQLFFQEAIQGGSAQTAAAKYLKMPQSSASRYARKVMKQWEGLTPI